MGSVASAQSLPLSGLHCDWTLCNHQQLANGRYAIANSVTAAKDQTYALYNLTQEQFLHTLMPVGDYKKTGFEIAAKSVFR